MTGGDIGYDVKTFVAITEAIRKSPRCPSRTGPLVSRHLSPEPELSCEHTP
jgi:hypothetical protein